MSKTQSAILSTLMTLFITCNGAILAHEDNKASEDKVTIEWQTQGDLKEAQEVFVKAFAHAYKDIPLEVLKVDNLLAFLHAAFEDEARDMKEMPGFHCAVAKVGQQTAGYIAVEPGENEGETYIRQCAVDPELWRHKIGTQLVDAIAKKLPETKKLLVIFRKVNTGGSRFYHSIGFKDSPYMHHKYSPERYVGCEKELSTMPSNLLTIEPAQEVDLKVAEELFVASCIQAYKDIITCNDLEAYLRGIFACEYEDFKKSGKYFFTAKIDNRIIGFISFESTNNENEVYISILAVDTSVQKQGIGTKLMNMVLEQLPNTKKIVLITRRLNKKSCNFYTKLGFKQSDFIHEGFSPEVYVGFEKEFKN